MCLNPKILDTWKIYPSILSANPLHMGEELQAISRYSDGLHWDIMDGHYVPNFTFGPHLIQKARTLLPKTWFDLHIMASPADEILPLFTSMDIQSLAFHPDTVANPLNVLLGLRQHGIKPGLAINLEDDISSWPKILWDCADYVLVMAVKPGFSGQIFNAQCLQHIAIIKNYIPHKDILVDGGIVPETAALCKKAGATGVISGNFLFQNHAHKERVQQLRDL